MPSVAVMGSMRRLRLTLRPGDVSLHPVGDVFLDPAVVDRAEAWTWNVEAVPVALLFLVRGDREAVADAIAATDAVLDHEIVSVDDESFYLYVTDEPTELAWAVFQTLNQRGLVAVPPVVYADGAITLSLLGDPETLQAVVDEMPAPIDATVEQVGTAISPIATPASVLSPRQREALAAGVAVGYYDVPRSAGHEAVAEALDCAPSTAAEHLQKAEARVVCHLVDGA